MCKLNACSGASDASMQLSSGLDDPDDGRCYRTETNLLFRPSVGAGRGHFGDCFVSGRRWEHADAQHVDILRSTAAEQVLFRDIKTALIKHIILHFSSSNRRLRIDFDTSAIAIGIVVYHIDEQALKKMTDADGHSYEPCTRPTKITLAQPH